MWEEGGRRPYGPAATGYWHEEITRKLLYPPLLNIYEYDWMIATASHSADVSMSFWSINEAADSQSAEDLIVHPELKQGSMQMRVDLSEDYFLGSP